MLKYADIQSGDNLLVSTDSWLGETIADFQNCKFNHAGKLLVIRGVVYVCEATKDGICLTKIEKYFDKKKYTILIQKPVEPFTDAELDVMFDFMLPKCGHIKYEFLNLFLYQPIKFITSVWIGAKTEKKADKRYICGEWVSRIDNVVRGYFPNWEKLAPVELFESKYYKNFII